MPLTSKGKKIMRAMRKQYGEKEGEKVFYASKNKGTISGVEKTEESKMSYLEKVLSISEEEKRGIKPGSMLADMGFTGAKKTNLSKLPKGKKTLKNPDQNIAPLGKKNESHTEYKRMGTLMAEALGYRVDEVLQALAPIGAGLARGAAAAGKVAGRVGMQAAKAGAKTAGRLGKQAAKAGVRAGGNAARSAGRAVGNFAKDAAADMAARKMEKMKDKEMEMENSWTVYKQIGIAIAEAREAYIDKESQAEVKAKKPDGGFAGPMARGVSKPGGKGVAGAATKDKFVRSSIRRGGEAIKKKVPGANPAKIATKNLAQVGKQLNKKSAKKRGLGIPRETPDIARADREEDKKKMAGRPERPRRR